MIDQLRSIFHPNFFASQGLSLDAEYAPARRELRLAGLSETELRSMDPDDRVAVLEQARLDPYDYIFLAC